MYADDISQIITLPGSVNYLTKQVPRAIESINNFENKWKIKTNQSKFQLIAIDRIKPPDITVSNTIIKHSREGKVLGLTLTCTGFTKHIRNRTQLAKLQLNKLYRFKNLSSKNKRKLYLLLVRAKLLYPIIPLHTCSKSQMSNMQRVQNRATRFITNSSRTDHITSIELHRRTNLEPINITLQRQAQEIWNSITANIQPASLTRISGDDDRVFTKKYPSSKLSAFLQTDPQYL